MAMLISDVNVCIPPYNIEARGGKKEKYFAAGLHEDRGSPWLPSVGQGSIFESRACEACL